MAAVCALSCLGLGFKVAPQSGIAVAGVLLLAAAMVFGRVRGRRALQVGATAFLQMTLFTLIGVVLSYALAARAGPAWDAQFAAADRALGLDWPMIFGWADYYPAALWLGALAYHGLTVQMITCIVVLSATGQHDRLRIAVVAAIAGGFATILISGLLPAFGNVFDPRHYRHLWPSVAWMEQAMLVGLRDGSWRTIDLTQPMGIVTFPSFHATLPIILAWATWRTPRWRAIVAAWAAVTIAATPLFGGHYLVDVLAGLGLGGMALALAQRIRRPSVSRRPGVPVAGARHRPATVVRSDGLWSTASPMTRKVGPARMPWFELVLVAGTCVSRQVRVRAVPGAVARARHAMPHIKLAQGPRQ